MNKNFGWALDQLRSGARVQRTGWNGRGMWLVLVNDWSFGGAAAEAFNAEPLPQVSSFIGMKTTDNKFVPWLASQTDVLATDWQVAE